MTAPPHFGFGSFVQLLLVVGLAAGLRGGYLNVAADNGHGLPALAVQGNPPTHVPGEERLREQPPSGLDDLVHNLTEQGEFAARAPLSRQPEPTAHVAPGYYWLVAQVGSLDVSRDAVVRWAQCALGALTAGCLFLFARRVFGNDVTALLTGLLAALHPFWIVNTAELNDGVVTTFLLAVALLLGTRGGQAGGAFASLLFGLSLAGLAMVRAATLPFAVVALLWFLYQCKYVRHGWFNALLALLGFGNGLAPWAVRNWNAFEEPAPIVTSAYLHAWIGNNPSATGGPLDETALRKSLPPERLDEALAESNQAKRYAALGRDVLEEVRGDPTAAITRRWQAGMKFMVGAEWFATQRLSRDLHADAEVETAAAPEWLTANCETWLQASLLALVVLALLGWRWSHAWQSNSRLAAFAFLWLPLPYLLTHAEELSGPRLPWDALLICYSAYAVSCLAPGVAGGEETA
ncbi:MAG: glycosyltransferase family 39 protein [Gemmataceae bacterium]|nr:glycosyltransferase family 39 protein [Gemmataceae bacterium]